MKNLLAIFVCVLIAGCDINPPEPIEIPWKKESSEYHTLGYYTLNLLDGRVFLITSPSRGKVNLLLYKRGLGGSDSPDIIGTYDTAYGAKKAFRVLYKLEKAME